MGKPFARKTKKSNNRFIITGSSKPGDGGRVKFTFKAVS
jgi:hypothetical protein